MYTYLIGGNDMFRAIFGLIVRLITEPLRTIRLVIEALTEWNAKASGSPAEAEIILTQAAGDLTGGGSSDTNIALAAFATHMARQHQGLRIYAQGEVAEHVLPELLVGRTRRQDEVEKYLTTRDVVEEQAGFCRRHGMRRVMVVAFAEHVWRTKKVYEASGLTAIVPDNLPPLVCQKNNEQPHCRSKSRFIAREFAARLYFIGQRYL